MKRSAVLPAFGAWLLAVGVCLAADTVRKESGTVTGRVVGMSPLEVEVEEVSTMRTKVPVNEIVTIFYEGAPAAMTKAWNHLDRGAYNEALDTLEAVDPETVNRREIAQDITFYKALCRARLALAGGGEIADAGREMAAFVVNERGSYHWLQANEVVGDLLVANGQFDKAEAYYTRLGQAPWPDYKMRAGVAIGRAQLAQGKTDEALQSFETVLAIDASGDLAQAQRLAASLGKARCLAAKDQHQEAISLIKEILGKADPEEVELHARAYNALGTALRRAGRTKDALMAFLHVDVLYSAVPDAHAEALANLAELWTELRKADRAVRCRRILEERYANSRWAT